MTGWKRILRGMIGMGLVFGVGVGSIGTILALFAYFFLGASPEIGIIVVGSAVWSGLMGVVFSGALALLGRGKTFDEISLPKVAGLGFLGGAAAFGLLALNAWDAWTLDAAVANGVLLTFLGTTAASASLLIARKAAPQLPGGDDLDELGDGDLERLGSGPD